MGRKSARLPAGFSAWETLAVFAVLLPLSASAVVFFEARGELLCFGDAQAHLAIARRMIDSRTPGWHQIGTVWLPLPHLLMLPFAGDDDWWRSGMGGAIPSAVCFTLAGGLLFAAARRALSSTAAGWAVAAIFALNPNALYLQAVPMTEAVLFASLAALLYTTLVVWQTGSAWAAAAAGLAGCAAALTRYEGWFVLPFVTAFLVFRGWRLALLFSLIAALGPLYWLAHNWWFYGDPLEFYRGYYSARMIYQRALDQGMARYPGDGNWRLAIRYFSAAAELCAGTILFWTGLAGLLAAGLRKAWWAVLLLLLPSVFYVWSLHSSGTPIFVPHLEPHSLYNTRYGLAMLPLLALGAGAIAALPPLRFQRLAAAILVLACTAPWLWRPSPGSWICWKEAQVNSQARRQWTQEAAAYLRRHYKPRQGIFTSFGDLVGIFRQAGIPLRATLNECNQPHWDAAVARPDLFLWEDWAVTIAGDKVSSALHRAGKTGPRFRTVQWIQVQGAPVIEIWRRDDPRKAIPVP